MLADQIQAQMPLMRKWRRRRLLVAVCLVMGLAPFAVAAQVLEIGDGGGVTVYDGPAVYTAHGAQPIPRGSPTPRRGGSPVAPPALNEAARSAALSAALVEAVAWRESQLRPGALSRAGAVGEMQLMPKTARALGVDPWISRQNFSGGAKYLRVLLTRYDGDLVKTLAAYNAGPEAVDRYGGVPPFKETQAYVAAILDRLSRRALNGDGAGSKR